MEVEKIYRPQWAVIIVGSIVWGGLFVISVVETIQDPSGLPYLLFAGVAFSVFLYWIRRMRILVNFEGVSHKWDLWKEARLSWQDIGAIETTTKLQAIHNPKAPMMTIEYRTFLRSNNLSKKDIAIDLKKFGKRDLTEFANLLIQHSTGTLIDEATKAMAQGQMPQYFFRKK